MVKCTFCSKVVTKKAPGLECNRRSSIVHASTACTQLSDKQLHLLRSAENLEWTCNDCSVKSPRRGSFLTPDDDAADEDDEIASKISAYPFDVKTLVADMSSQMDKIIKRELKVTNQAIQYAGNKIDECLESIEVFKERIKELEKKNFDLVNKNKHLERRLDAQEQRIHEKDQKELKKVVEVQGIPTLDKKI